jgi:hypothetical protein
MSSREMLNSDPATLPPHLVELVAGLPPDLRALVAAMPQRLMDVLAAAPVYSERRSGADLLRQHVIPVSRRSLEAWPLPWQHANGKAITLTIALFAVAHAKLAAAPLTMGGRRSQTRQSAA